MGRLMRGAVCAVFLAGITGIYLANHGFSRMFLSDGLSLGGLLLLLLGGWVRLAGAGAVDGLAYCGHTLLAVLIPGRQVVSYRAFVSARKKTPRPRGGVALVMGALALLLGVLLLP